MNLKGLKLPGRRTPISLTLNRERPSSVGRKSGSNLFRDLRTDLDFNRRNLSAQACLRRPALSPQLKMKFNQGLNSLVPRETDSKLQKSLPLHLGRLESNTVKFEVVP